LSIFVSRWLLPLARADAGLVCFWKFDEGMGTEASDSSGHGNNGTLMNMEANDWVTGKHHYGLHFDGVNEYVKVNQSLSLDITDGVSVAAWVYPKAFPTFATILSRWYDATQPDRGLVFQIKDGTHVRFGVISDANLFDVPYSFEADRWYHMAATWNGSISRVYVYGTEIGNRSTSGTFTNQNLDLAIGADIYPLAGYFNGTIDEVRLYNTALSQQEIKALVFAGPQQPGEPVLQWSKIFGGGVGYSVRQTSDGGYITLAEYPCILIKTDSDGNHEWNKTYAGRWLGESDGSNLQQTSDGGYIVVGSVDVVESIWLVKVDSFGSHQWNKTFGKDGCGYSVQQTSDGGYILVGYADFDSWLIKTDASGNQQWNKTLGEPDFDPKSVRQTSDGGYIVAGIGLVHLVKTDSEGNHQWNKTFEGSVGWSVQQTTDGGYILATHKFDEVGPTDFQLIKTDSVGNHQWNETYGGPEQDLPFSVEQTSDGGYVMAGFTHSFGAGAPETSDFWVVKTDAGGNHEWNQTYGGPGTEHAFAIQQTIDGGYILVGYRTSYGVGGVWLVKLGHSDVAVTNIEAWPTGVPKGDPVYINVTVENQGDVVETFEVVMYADQVGLSTHFDIGNETVCLDVEESTILEFVWDTTDAPLGSYYITAEAILPRDADSEDNTASTKVGGICIPYSPSPVDIVGLLIPIASAVIVVVLLGAAALAVFRTLMSERLRKPQ